MPNVEWTNKNTLQNLIDTIHARLIQKVPHYTTMPTASADLLGEVVQFVGETNVNYTNAFFYKCNSVEDETTGAISYAWEAVDVQASTGISAKADNAIVELPDGLYAKAVQIAALPIATVDNLGVIYEYTGATTGSLINGYFYKNEAVEDETTGDIIYEWHKINVQDPTAISEEDDNAILELPDGIYVKLVQVSTMPEAVEGNANVIYQFVGETTADYTCGYFYKNVGTEDETTGEITYAWTTIATQEEIVKHWIGTRAELELAIEAGEIENGTIILITDEPDVDELPTENSTNLVYSGGVWTTLQEKQDVIQYAELPEAGEDYVGKIFQYIGETDSSYTKGFFYRCAEVPNTDPTEYEWVNQEVQESTDSEAKVNATAVTSLSGLADGFYLLIDSTATPIYQLKGIADGTATDSDKEVDTCLIDYVLYNENKTVLDTLDIVWVVTGTPDISDYKTEFETAKSGVRSNADYTFEWDSDILSVGDFADLKSQWNDFAVFMHNNKGRLAMITIDQYNFGFSDDDTGGSSPTLICIIPELASTSEEYNIRIPYGTPTSTHCDGYGFGFIDINWRLTISSGKCDFAGINTILFKGTDSMSTGYTYLGSNASSVYINETEYSMSDATERAAAYGLYHQGITIVVKLL